MCIYNDVEEVKLIHAKPNRQIKAYKVLTKYGRSMCFPNSSRKQSKRWGPGIIHPSKTTRETRQVIPVSVEDMKKDLSMSGQTGCGLYVIKTGCWKEVLSWQDCDDNAKIIPVYIYPKDVIFTDGETLVCNKIKIRNSDWEKVFNKYKDEIQRFV